MPFHSDVQHSTMSAGMGFTTSVPGRLTDHLDFGVREKDERRKGDGPVGCQSPDGFEHVFSLDLTAHLQRLEKKPSILTSGM